MGKNFDNTRAGALQGWGSLSQGRLAFSSSEVETHDRAEAKEVSPGDSTFP